MGNTITLGQLYQLNSEGIFDLNAIKDFTLMDEESGVCISVAEAILKAKEAKRRSSQYIYVKAYLVPRKSLVSLLSANELRLLIYLESLLDFKNRIIVSRDGIREILKFSNNTIAAIFKLFKTCGIIEKKGMSGKGTIYQINPILMYAGHSSQWDKAIKDWYGNSVINLNIEAKDIIDKIKTVKAK